MGRPYRPQCARCCLKPHVVHSEWQPRLSGICRCADQEELIQTEGIVKVRWTHVCPLLREPDLELSDRHLTTFEPSPCFLQSPVAGTILKALRVQTVVKGGYVGCAPAGPSAHVVILDGQLTLVWGGV